MFTVKPASAIALIRRLPSGVSGPWETSVTLSEVTTPVKLPTRQCPDHSVRIPDEEGRYFKVDSMTPGDATSRPPAYPTHPQPVSTTKL